MRGSLEQPAAAPRGGGVLRSEKTYGGLDLVFLNAASGVRAALRTRYPLPPGV